VTAASALMVPLLLDMINATRLLLFQAGTQASFSADKAHAVLRIPSTFILKEMSTCFMLLGVMDSQRGDVQKRKGLHLIAMDGIIRVHTLS